MAATLPAKRYDPANFGHVVEIDQETKDNSREAIRNGLLGLTQTIRLIGLFMATYEGQGGSLLTDEDRVDIGFTINGLADLTEQLLSVDEELDEAAAIGNPKAEDAEAALAD